MKYALIVLLLGTGVSQAAVNDTWKELNQYRAVSGLKAVIIGFVAAHATLKSWESGKTTARLLSDSGDPRSIFSVNRGNEIAGHAVVTLGMGYMAYMLSFDYLPKYLKHALAL